MIQKEDNRMKQSLTTSENEVGFILHLGMGI